MTRDRSPESILFLFLSSSPPSLSLFLSSTSLFSALFLVFLGAGFDFFFFACFLDEESSSVFNSSDFSKEARKEDREKN